MLVPRLINVNTLSEPSRLARPIRGEFDKFSQPVVSLLSTVRPQVSGRNYISAEVIPPSTYSVAPLTNEASSAASINTAAATSSG